MATARFLLFDTDGSPADKIQEGDYLELKAEGAPTFAITVSVGCGDQVGAGAATLNTFIAELTPPTTANTRQGFMYIGSHPADTALFKTGTRVTKITKADPTPCSEGAINMQWYQGNV